MLSRREVLVAAALASASGCARRAEGDGAAGSEDAEPVRGHYRSHEAEHYYIVRTGRRPYVIWGRAMNVRGLDRRADGGWWAGPRLLQFEPAADEFATMGGGAALVQRGEVERRAPRLSGLERDVWLETPGGRLAADLYLPKGPVTGGVVMVHGSGPHQRDGHLGLHRYMGYRFARAGLAAVTWAKRGVGGSECRWETQSLADLGSDVAFAARWLVEQAGVPRGAVGAWGTSQAGWVTALAIARHGAEFRAVNLVSAAGTGLSVAEQDIAYLRVEMARQGISSDRIEAVIASRRALFDFIATGDAAPYDRANERATAIGVGDWLTPPSSLIDRAARDAWYSTMELDFDPRPVWRDYPGSLLAIYGSEDSQTPARMTAGRLRAALGPDLPARHTIEIVDGATHELLIAEPGAKDPLGEARNFHARSFDRMAAWMPAVLASGARQGG